MSLNTSVHRNDRKREVSHIHSVSVVLPVRNRAVLIKACLEQIREKAATALEKDISLEVVVANDGSTDGTYEVVEDIANTSPFPIKQVYLKERQGPARARNAALERVTGELVIFVDSDVLIEDGFFEAHVAAHNRAARSIFGCGALVTVPSLKDAIQRPQSTVWDYSGATLDTANTSVRLQDLQAVNFFDSGYEGMGWQDLDLGKRLLKHGVERHVVKEAVGYHIVPPIRQQEQLENRLAKEAERGVSAVRYMQKHPGLSTKLAAQNTFLHPIINWFFRMGGLVHKDNVLHWAQWARRRRLVALEKMWLAGVINQAHLQSLRATLHEQRERSNK